MTHLDDTDLDGLAAQARSFPPLDVDEVARLLQLARAEGVGPAHRRLVEHHLLVALDQAIARGGRGIDVVDLYQEGTLAATVAVSEFAARSGEPSRLRAYVARVVGAHLDDVLTEAALEEESTQAIVRDVQAYESAEANLRFELGRGPSPTEIAAVLEWPEDRVVMVGGMLAEARAMYDTDIVTYLDDN